MALARVNVSSGGGSKTPKLVSVPVQSGTLTYTGSAKSPTWSGYDATQLTISGTTSATDAGTYTATFTPKSGYTWTDGTSSPKDVTWTIGKDTSSLSTSISDSSLVYGDTATISITANTSGGAISATSSNPAAVVVQSVTSSTITIKCVGVSSESTTITITAAETSNYLSVTKTRSVSTAKADGSITLSATEGTVTYGTPFTFTVTSNVSGGELSVKSHEEYVTASITGNTVTLNYVAASSGKTITVISAETANYKKATATFKVVLERATCELSLSRTSSTVTQNGYTTFTVTTPSDGKISVTSSDKEVATATISGNTVTVTGKASDGSATITVSQKQNTWYAAPESKNFLIRCREVQSITDSWDTISVRSKNGTADAYYNIGDYKEITLNGKIGDCLTLENEKLRVCILHLNLPMNGVAENNIIWGGFQSTDGTDVALCDAKYNTNSTDGTICFNINHWGDCNYGGWKGCDLRYDILGATSTAPSDYGKAHTTECVGYDATAATLTSPKADTLLAALPADFRNALRLWSRWGHTKGDDDPDAESVEETIDAVTLMIRNQEFAYYSPREKQQRYEHTNTSSSCSWWLAAPNHGQLRRCSFAYVSGYYTNVFSACRAYALAPAFKT